MYRRLAPRIKVKLRDQTKGTLIGYIPVATKAAAFLHDIHLGSRAIPVETINQGLEAAC
jgi:hypothetical protein